MIIKDHEKILPRDAPLILYTDIVPLPATKAERHLMEEKVPGMRDLLDGKFAGVHFRPLGGANSDEMCVFIYEFGDLPSLRRRQLWPLDLRHRHCIPVRRPASRATAVRGRYGLSLALSLLFTIRSNMVLSQLCYGECLGCCHR